MSEEKRVDSLKEINVPCISSPEVQIRSKSTST